MSYKRKSKVWTIIKLIIVLSLIWFIYGCYNIEFLKNNKYVIIAKSKIEQVVNTITNKVGDIASLVENYESDEEDNTIYEITNSQDRYYYDQLDDTSKIIYAEILNNLDRIKAGEDNIKISSKLSVLAEKDDMNTSLISAFQNAWDAFRNDNVDVFYIDGTKMSLVTKTIKIGKKTSYEFYISKGNNANYLLDEFENEEEVNEAIKFVTNYENQILNTVTEKNDYYKILKINNWMVDNLEYNLEESSHNGNLYGALKNKKVVCEGYARLFKSFMDKLEIPCVLVSGEGIDLETNSSENHAWNYVYLKGNWYAIDVTWNDPIIKGTGIPSPDLKYKYFLKGSKEFSSSHIEDGKLVENGLEFSYPVICEQDYVKEK